VSIEVINRDALDWLEDCKPVKCIFADPPDNLGLKYDGYLDKLPAREYYYFLELLMVKAMRKCQVLWLSYYHEHDLQVSRILAYQLQHHPWHWRKVIWRFNFGQYNGNGMASGYRPILMCWSPAAKLYWDKIRVVSERMRAGDPRATGLRIPDDVWEIPRVVGNSPERRSWHPTQHPEELMERVLLLSCGYFETVADIFAGTGTTGRVAKRLGIPCQLVELSPAYCEHIRRI
jgi:DNA modification methylase